MDVRYDAAAIRRYLEDLEDGQREIRTTVDGYQNAYESGVRRYTRLSQDLQDRIDATQRRLRDAEEDYESAEAAYDSAMQEAGETEDADAAESCRHRAQAAADRMNDASRRIRRESTALAGQKQKMSRLTGAWNSCMGQAGALRRSADEAAQNLQTAASGAARDLQEFERLMVQGQAALQDGGTVSGYSGGAYGAGSGYGGASGISSVSGITSARSGAAEPSGNAPSAEKRSGRGALGWCPSQSMRTVSLDGSGKKNFGMNIGGEDLQFRCNRSGAAKAYRAAVASGDADLIARTSAIYEVEVLRADLELGTGEAGVPQLGGYHRDVKQQDPKGYESHHIPARSVQDADAEWLPTISISEEDHTLTSSYRGKQRHVYKPCFPDGVASGTYKQEISNRIAKGSSGYIEAMRNEIYDLRVTTGHRYDGGISAYLDAVIDMIASQGIPESK